MLIDLKKVKIWRVAEAYIIYHDHWLRCASDLACCPIFPGDSKIEAKTMYEKEAHQDPDGLMAWMGNLKADEVNWERLESGSIRWLFEWRFRASTKIKPVEFIYDHELVCDKTTAWDGEVLAKGETYSIALIITAEGEVIR